MLDSAVMGDDWLCRLWVWCMLKAKWRGSERGTFITGRVVGADELKVSPSKFYRGLIRLADLGCITLEANSQRTTIKVCNYSTYQDKEADFEPKVNSERTADEQHLNNLPLVEERKKERRQEEAATPAAKNEAQGEAAPAAAKDATNGEIHSPAWLARKWVFLRRGTKGREELDRARTTFEEMIRLGCDAAQIAVEIDRPERRKTEPIWDFEKRMIGEKNGTRPAQRGPDNPYRFKGPGKPIDTGNAAGSG